MNQRPLGVGPAGASLVGGGGNRCARRGKPRSPGRERVSAKRLAMSTAKLRRLPAVHWPPHKRVVYPWPYEPKLGEV